MSFLKRLPATTDAVEDAWDRAGEASVASGEGKLVVRIPNSAFPPQPRE